jgi:tRNA A-37 threonylcarbamoyl transferase component Bud32
LERDGVRWVSVPDFEPALSAILADPGQVIKKTPTKLVTCHQINGRPVYLKRYLNYPVRFRPMKYFFKPSEATNEWALAEKVAARGIPVVRHLAVGERWTRTGLQESLIITEGFDGVRLDKYDKLRSDALQTALARLLRLMHDRGVLQPDLHHNILVHEHPLELCRIDVDRGQVKPSLTDEERFKNLSYINQFVPLLEKFFEVYGEDAAYAKRVRRRSAVMRRPLCARRARWVTGNNLRFEPRQIGGLKWWVRKELFSEPVQRLLTNPDGALQTCQKLFKSGPNRTSTVGAFDGLVLKRFNVKKKSSLFKDVFRVSRARRAYQHAYHLELLGIPTPRPIAAAERRVLRVLVHSYFVMEEIPGAIDFGQYLERVTQADRGIIQQVATLVARLHEDGFSHRDLKETNLALDRNNRAYVLDLDGLTYRKKISADRAAADLERIARAAAKYPSITHRERLAFLLTYCRTRGLTPQRLFGTSGRAPG